MITVGLLSRLLLYPSCALYLFKSLRADGGSFGAAIVQTTLVVICVGACDLVCQAWLDRRLRRRYADGSSQRDIR